MFGKGWGTQTNCIQRCVSPDEGSGTGGKGTSGLPRRVGLGTLPGLPGDAVGCFCPSKESPEPGRALLWVQGGKNRLWREPNCVLLRQCKGWDRGDQAGREGFGTRWAVVGSPGCRAFRKETSRLLGSHKHSSLVPWSQHRPHARHPPQLCLSVCPVPRAGSWSWARAGPVPLRSPARCYNQVENNFPFSVAWQNTLTQGRVQLCTGKVQRSRRACEQRVCSTSRPHLSVRRSCSPQPFCA